MPGTPKQFNSHKFPNATRQPRHLDNLRKEGAKERQEAYDKLSLEEKIARLPAEPGAKRQRARLMALKEKKASDVDNAQKVRAARLQEQIDKAVSGEAAPTNNPREMTDRAANQRKNQQKKYMKGAK